MRYLNSLLYLVLLLFLSVIVLMNLTPPICRDALIHHLAIPKLWIRHGGYYEMPWADFSYYPMNVDLLYWIALYFKNDIAPKFIHAGLGVGTAWMVHRYLKTRIGYSWGLFGAVIFLSTPIVVWLCTSAYIDLGMTFFTTASIFCLLKWRDTRFVTRWLVLSGCFMGLAVGSKYNALIAALFVNLMVVFIFSRDTKKQFQALGCGAVFFATTLIIASPWFIKNCWLTGNPFYPLFGGLFRSLHLPLQEALTSSIQSQESVGFLRIRKVLYGESAWETFLIPIRMFFQGDDNSYQYFQGKLNPLLIVFTPFLFLNKRFKADKFLFGSFSIFYLVIAFFSTAQQVRYLMPIFPFLAILAAMGINDLLKWMEGKHHQKYLQAILFAGLAGLLFKNVIYLEERMALVQPLPYIFGKESRDDFLSRHLLDYPAVTFINAHLPSDARIYTIYLGRRGYYLDRDYVNDVGFGRGVLGKMMESSIKNGSLNSFSQMLGASHILMRTDVADRFLHDNYSNTDIDEMVRRMNRDWRLLYQDKTHAVWDIRGAS
jgi:hypothetical protein